MHEAKIYEVVRNRGKFNSVPHEIDIMVTATVYEKDFCHIYGIVDDCYPKYESDAARFILKIANNTFDDFSIDSYTAETKKTYRFKGRGQLRGVVSQESQKPIDTQQ